MARRPTARQRIEGPLSVEFEPALQAAFLGAMTTCAMAPRHWRRRRMLKRRPYAGDLPCFDLPQANQNVMSTVSILSTMLPAANGGSADGG